MAVPVPIKPADARKQIPITKILPKKSTGKVNGKKIGTTSSGSESESDSDLEIEEPPEASPIPPSRPTEPEAAANYDTLRAVWFPRNRRPHADKVKSALVAFKDVVKKVRDAWKDKTQAMKMAENKGDNDKAAKFKKETAAQRRIMDVVVKTTLEKAHPTIIEKYVFFFSPSPFFFYPSTNLAYRCHGHRSQKRIESLSHVISIKGMLISKGGFSGLHPRTIHV